MTDSSLYSRRHFLKTSAAAALAFGGVQRLLSSTPAPTLPITLLPDPNGILDLPEGFKYTVVSRAGERMSDGFLAPGSFDGMGVFAGPSNTTVLIRNHELTGAQLDRSPYGKQRELLTPEQLKSIYDPGYGKTPQLGGTTTLVLDAQTNELQTQFLSLGGTVRNCAGGITPWGSWITCEEATDKA